MDALSCCDNTHACSGLRPRATCGRADGDSVQADWFYASVCRSFFAASLSFSQPPSVTSSQTRLLAGNEAALIKDFLSAVSCFLLMFADDEDESMITGFLIDSCLRACCSMFSEPVEFNFWRLFGVTVGATLSSHARRRSSSTSSGR